MTHSVPSHVSSAADHADASTRPEDVIHCAWGPYVALRGLSRGQLLGAEEYACKKVATHWLDLIYKVPYPPSESPLPFCEDHRAEVIRHFEGWVPNYRLGGEEAIEVRKGTSNSG